MKKAHTSETAPHAVVRVLSVGQAEEDDVSLETLLRPSAWALRPNAEWELIATPNVNSALAVLRNGLIPIVVCERDLRLGTWKEMLEQLARLPDAPLLIVTSRLADERLWAEAMNLGAYDVLLKPFDGDEVVRILGSAWLHWLDRSKFPVGAAASLPLASGM